LLLSHAEGNFVFSCVDVLECEVLTLLYMLFACNKKDVGQMADVLNVSGEIFGLPWCSNGIISICIG
jgi:hypothetical protein